MAAHSTRHAPSRTRKAVLAVALSLGIAVSGATAAYAVYESAGGGTWHHGAPAVIPSNNWSNYLHPTEAHGSSVTGDRGLVQSACREGGVWSKANAWDSNPFRWDVARWYYC